MCIYFSVPVQFVNNISTEIINQALMNTLFQNYILKIILILSN